MRFQPAVSEGRWYGSSRKLSGATISAGCMLGSMGPHADARHSPQKIQLPHSSTRLQRKYAHCKVLTEVRLDKPYNVGFEGTIHAPGAVVQATERMVVLECVGPERPRRGRQSAVTWVLWKWSNEAGEWQEIARASAINWEWALTLKQAAYDALHPRTELYDVLQRGREVAGELMETIEERLNPEPQEVRSSAWAAIHDQSAGRMAVIS